jgi:serine/threonine-protein kinase
VNEPIPPAATIDPPPTPERAAETATFDTLPREAPSPLQGVIAPPGYEILGLLGRGGMGAVYRARDLKLLRDVALKMMSTEMASHDLPRKRFIREARAAAAVSHENVVAIHAVDEEQPIPFLVMQLIDGRTLVDVIKNGPAPIDQAIEIGVQIARGLQAAHAKGLVHRDIKPANILIENGTARVKITDFGLARALHEDSISQSGAIVGTPLFMAPEQARGEEIDHRADLFSLGAVLYALCAGQSPFMANNTMAVLRRVCDEPAPPLARVNPAVPSWLEQIVHQLLEKDPARRPSSAEQIALSLEAGRTSPVIIGAGTETRPFVPARLKSAKRFNRRLGMVAAGVLLCVGVGLSIRWANTPDKKESAPPAPPVIMPAPAPQVGPTGGVKGEIMPTVQFDSAGFDQLFKMAGAPVSPSDLLKMHPLLKNDKEIPFPLTIIDKPAPFKIIDPPSPIKEPTKP